jgi:RibD C-terminal domain
VTKQGGTSFTFVTDGSEAALEQARAAAGDKDVALGGGASVAQQYLKAGLLDELQIHLVPVLLGGGTRLFDRLGPTELEITRVIASPSVTHTTLPAGLAGQWITATATYSTGDTSEFSEVVLVGAPRSRIPAEAGGRTRSGPATGSYPDRRRLW